MREMLEPKIPWPDIRLENLYPTDIPIDKELLSTPEVIPSNIAAVIPAYNEQEGLETTLQSLDRFGLSMIVAVDDGSEPPLEVSSNISTPFELIRHDKNKGCAAARNTGISATKSDWIYNTDCGCIHDPDIFVSYRKSQAAAGPNVSAIAGPIVATTRGRLGRFYTQQGILNALHGYNEDNILVAKFIVCCNALVSRTAMDQAGHFDEKTYGTNFGEDSDLAIRLWHVGKILWCGYAEVAHEFTESLDVFDLRFKKYGKGMRLISDKHNLGWYPQLETYGLPIEGFKDLNERRLQMELKGFLDV
jgi:glycosyltransferase involved in cell wall biosynthesis